MLLLLSSLWVFHSRIMGFDFIIIAPLLLSHCSFSFVFGCGISFLELVWHLPVDRCSTDSYNFGALTVGDDHTSFCSAILNQPSYSFLLSASSGLLFCLQAQTKTSLKSQVQNKLFSSCPPHSTLYLPPKV